MNLITFKSGPIATNVYIIYNENREAVIVDPAFDGEKIAQRIEGEGLTLKAILITHYHFDHIDGVARLAKLTGAKVYSFMPGRDTSYAFTSDKNEFRADEYLTDGQSLELIGAEFSVISTPGHTTDSVCYILDDMMFSGDTLFFEECGRCDLPGGNFHSMQGSLKKLAALDGDYKVYPGHQKFTTLEHERRNNMYMNK